MKSSSRVWPFPLGAASRRCHREVAKLDGKGKNYKNFSIFVKKPKANSKS